MIKKEGSKWNVYDSKGKKKLGNHATRKDAVQQLRAIEANKNK
jgi:hypothetical protein